MKRSARKLLVAGALTLCAVLVLKAAALLIPSGTWAPERNLSSARAGASAAPLHDGRVLVTGGDSDSGPVNTADFFSPDGAISPAPPMIYSRSNHISVTLPDGRVLVAGGTVAGGGATNAAEVFDPIANSWASIAGGTIEARSGATAALLQDGRVLIAGGQNGSLISSTLEIFDPTADAFTFAGTLSSPRTQHAMAVLNDGRVMIIGGFDGSAPLPSTDIFDPVAGTVTAGPSLAVARFGHSATTLLNGQVVVIGGNNGNANPAQMDVTPAELFDPTSGTFATLATNLTTPREGHLAFLLPNNNNVLIAGGVSGGTTVASVELFAPQESAQGGWTYGFGPTGSMTAARSNAAGSPNQLNAPSSVMQRNGVLMVAGGHDANGDALNAAEAYGYPTIQTDQSDYPPGTAVTITGSGWKAGEIVNLQLVESPLIDTHGPYTVQADANGNITDSSLVTDSHDVNVRFYLTATGASSGFHAQNTFTDANPQTLSITTAQNPNPLPAGSSAAYGLTEVFNGNNTSCTVDLTAAPNGSPSWPSPPPGGFFSFSPSSLTTTGTARTSTLTIDAPPNMAAATYNFTVTATPRAGTCQNNPKTLTVDGTLVVEAPLPTTLTVSAVSGTYGGTVNLSAVLTKTSGGTAIAAQSIAFTLNGVSVGSGTTDASGTAILNDVSLAGIAVATYTGGANSGVGASFAAANGFAPSNGTATLTVNKATPTFSNLAASTIITYGTASVTLSGTISAPGPLYPPTGETVSITINGLAVTPSIEASGAFSTSFDTHLIPASATPYTISYSYTADTNFYGASDASTTLAVNKATAVVAITPYTVIYDGKPHTAAVTSITGVNGETGATVGTVDVSNTTHSDAGTYASDTWSFTGTANYNNIAATTITDTINKAPLTVKVQDASATYTGQPFSGAAVTYTGFVNGESSAVLSGTLAFAYAGVAPTIYAGPAAPTNAGTYSITPSGLTSGNYMITFSAGTLTVHPAPLTITADDKNMVLDGSLPSFTATYSGFVNSEGANVLGGTLTCLTSTTGTAVGTFTIICSGQSSTNYSIMYKSGTLTVQYASSATCGHQILQPVNADGTSVFKLGSTVPAKFRVCDANGSSVGPTITVPNVVKYFVLNQIVNGTVTATVDEGVDSTTPDTQFRWDPTAMQWIFNTYTKNLAANQTYCFVITLQDGTTIQYRFGLR